jgi:hypothetical protein
MGFVRGLGFRVWGLGFEINLVLEFMVYSLVVICGNLWLRVWV